MVEANNIDTLMDLDPLQLTVDGPELDAIIAYHRKARANAAGGVKAKRESGPKVDISEALGNLIGAPAAQVPTVRRR